MLLLLSFQERMILSTVVHWSDAIFLTEDHDSGLFFFMNLKEDMYAGLSVGLHNYDTWKVY
jgi:hypothetical protein